MSDVPRIPPELIDYEIFSRLPVKSLLRFKCVSKHHYALIDSPVFIKTQLLNCTHSNQNIIFWNALNLYSLPLNSPNKPILLNHHPFVKYLFWNPSTRKHHDLPVTKFDLPVNPNMPWVSYGFGYDDVNDDYKLLRISQYHNEVTDKVMIYSLKSHSWQTLDDCPFLSTTQNQPFLTHGVFLDHSLHWLVLENSGSRIAHIFAFHLGTEKYHKVPHPRFSGKNLLVYMNKLGGKLCLNCICDKSHIDLWAMNTYGIRKSWTKLFSVQLPLFGHCCGIGFPITITYSKDGKQMLCQKVCNGELFWYDLKLGIFKEACIPDIPLSLCAFLSVESLVKLPHATDTSLIEDKGKSKKW
ncbi:F-box protein CPR1-like [Apium graveolens]|uniref:F-box protein CPR1-like n=1 Tax=Apium graveolens TaxID=4045 RepID=UPI003D7B6A2C